MKKLDSRNEDYWRIASELEAQAPPHFLPPHSSSLEEDACGGEHLMKSMDRIFVCGDLNYRIDLPRETVEKKIKDMECILNSNDDELLKEKQSAKIRLDLLRHDQLLRTLAEDSAFIDLTEGEIKFPPTFKFNKGSNLYDTSVKQRVPAWTDRVLFKPFGVQVLEYDSARNAIHSDHRPVFAHLKVNMMGAEINEELVKTKSKKKRKSMRRRQISAISNDSSKAEIRPKSKKRRRTLDHSVGNSEQEYKTSISHVREKKSLEQATPFNCVEANTSIKRKKRTKKRKEM